MCNLLVKVTMLLLASPVLAAEPSFDCARASAADETTICNDDRLSALDRLAAQAYDEASLSAGRKAARKAARAGLAIRRRCGDNSGCILSAQISTILVLQNLGATTTVPRWALEAAQMWSDGTRSADMSTGGLPTAIGACVNTTIAKITSRFQNDITASSDDGSAVDFANGGHQVAYEKVGPLVRSQIGDPVLMCLVALPTDCPPGDDRGRVYTTTNLRTTESWTLSDSQHSCGGA